MIDTAGATGWAANTVLQHAIALNGQSAQMQKSDEGFVRSIRA